MLRVFATVTLPLAAMNFVNQASRVVVATIGPLLAVELGLSASELGALAAVFFATYALVQLPLGLALDLFGARRVQTTLGLTAAAGFALCAFAEDALALGLGRAVTGVGIAAGLMAILKANTQWYRRESVAAATGAAMFVGAAGGLAATLPAQWLLPLIGWRGVFGLFAALAAAIGLWVWLSVPDRPPGAARPARRRLGREIAEFGRIVAHPVFRRVVPLLVATAGFNFTYQGLWAGPWLRDVAGLGAEARAAVLFCYALGAMTGSLIAGTAASMAQRRGFSPMAVPYLGMAGIAALQLVLMLGPRDPLLLGAIWFALAFCGGVGPAAYAAVGQSFGAELAGRVATAINASLLALVFVLQNAVGWILDLWPRADGGGWDPAAYSWALALTVALQALAAAWLLSAPRRRPA
jgi:predicted MFS family arabinose efflux permease